MTDFGPDYCIYDDHPEWGVTRRNVFMYVELVIILCSVVLAQTLKGYGHSYAYMIGFALCSLVFKMMPHAFGWYTLGTSNVVPGGASYWSHRALAFPLLTIQNDQTTWTIIAFQWFSTLAAGVVVQASGSFVWFENLLVKLFNSKNVRYVLPTACACLGVFSALACGTDAINLLYLSPIINASKVLGQRPSKSISAIVIAGMLGAACSPVNPAVQYYYSRYIMNVNEVSNTFDLADLMRYDHLSLALLPAAVVGALCSGIVATFIGNDLDKSKTYKRRCDEGLVSQPGEEDAAYYRRLREKNGDSTGVEQSVRREDETKVKTSKLEREFSMQSRLEDGDFVYTNARFRDGTYVDINDRQSAGNGGHTTAAPVQSSRKSVTINVKDESEASAVPAGEYSEKPMKSQKLEKQMPAVIAMGAMVAFGIYVLVWGVLKAIDSKKSPADSDLLDYIIPKTWPLPTSYSYSIVLLALAGILMLINRLREWQLTHSMIAKYSLPGILGSLCYAALGASWLEEWVYKFACITYKSKASKNHPFVWIFWVFITSIFTGQESLTQIRLSRRISAIQNLADRSRWLASAFPMAAGSFLLPTNANMLIAAELDDTGSTRLGTLLVDHVFLLPGIVGVAAAFGVAYGMSAALFP